MVGLEQGFEIGIQTDDSELASRRGNDVLNLKQPGDSRTAEKRDIFQVDLQLASLSAGCRQHRLADLVGPVTIDDARQNDRRSRPLTCNANIQDGHRLLSICTPSD